MSEVADHRCVHWPRTCAELQAHMDTYLPPCEFCRFGPPEPPTRKPQGGSELDLAGAQERIAKTERERGERLKSAIAGSIFEEAHSG